jgi:hypothetical protein
MTLSSFFHLLFIPTPFLKNIKHLWGSLDDPSPLFCSSKDEKHVKTEKLCNEVISPSFLKKNIAT